MKVSIEPQRLREFLRQNLLCGKKPFLESITVYFDKNGAIAKDVSLGVIGLYNLYLKEYFLDYECNETEKVAFTNTFLDSLSYGFTDEKVNVLTRDNKLIIEGKNERYSEDLVVPKEDEFPLKIKVSDKGVVLETLTPKVEVLLNSETLCSIPDSSEYKIISDGKGLKILITEKGTYEKTLSIDKAIKLENLEVKFDGEQLRSIINNIRKGQTYLAISENVLAIGQKFKDCAFGYFLSALGE